MKISYQATSNQALHTQKGTKKFKREWWKNRKDIPRTYSKKNKRKNTSNSTKTCTNEQHKTPTCPCISGNAISHRLTSYPSCWGLGWGHCGAYSGPEQRRKATDRTGWGCCWPSAAPGPARAGTPSCSGWGWKEGSVRKTSAAVAAGMLWLVDSHCSAGWRGMEEDICRAAVDNMTIETHTHRYDLFSFFKAPSNQ